MSGFKFNTYLSVVAIAAIALGAIFLITRWSQGSHTGAALGNEAQYQDLQQSILGSSTPR